MGVSAGCFAFVGAAGSSRMAGERDGMLQGRAVYRARAREAGTVAPGRGNASGWPDGLRAPQWGGCAREEVLTGLLP